MSSAALKPYAEGKKYKAKILLKSNAVSTLDSFVTPIKKAKSCLDEGANSVEDRFQIPPPLFPLLSLQHSQPMPAKTVQ